MPADRHPEGSALRVSDAEREGAARTLREHGATGRLDVGELEQRVELAYRARTRGDFAVLTRDLPAVPAGDPGRRTPGRPTPGRRQLAPFVAVMVVLVAVWAVTGAGYPCPVWPALGWGLPLLLGSRGVGACGARRVTPGAAGWPGRP
jgi:hypothetical protein